MRGSGREWYLSPLMKEEAIAKLALRGQSVIDWTRFFFTTKEEAKNFLKVNEFDLSRQRDLDRLMTVHNEAVGYLQRELQMNLPGELLNPENLVDFFLIASNLKNPDLQKKACSLLKTMNIINHIDGRELLYNCPISLRDLFSLVQDKIERALSALSRKEYLKYEGGRKPKESLITKLLCKRDTIASQIYDRVRYRIVTGRKEDIIKVLLYLFDTVLPFNYVIPSASVNQLILMDRSDRWALVKAHLTNLLPTPASRMEYSGKNYRVCKFVVDIPIRMDNFLATSSGPVYRESLGTIAYVLVEFQIVDEETDRSNKSGKCSHENYKTRQKNGVIKRLMGS